MTILLGWDNKADDATVTASSALATLPGANVQNQHVAKVWSTAAAVTTAYLIFDMLASVACQLLGVMGTNLTSAATVRIRASDSDATVTSSLLYDSGTIAAGIVSGYGAIYKALTLTTARYWRIDLTDASLTAGIQAGRVFLGPRWAPAIDMQLGASVSAEDPSQVGESYGGQEYADVRPQRRVLSFTLDYMNEAEMYGNAFALARAQGVVYDVLAIPDIDGSYLPQQAVWGRCVASEPIVNDKLALYRQKFTIKERL